MVSQQYFEVKQKYESVVEIVNKSRSEAQTAYQNYSQANRNAQYYANYYQNYKQEYETAQQQSKQWLATYKESETKYNAAQQESEKLKPEYDKISSEYNQTSQEYQETIDKYNSIAPKGAFHAAGISFKAIIALVFFSILSLFIGLINFQIFWDRKTKLSLAFRDNDEFTAIPVIAHYIQTIGESIGTYIGIMGTFTILIALTLKVCFGNYGIGRLYLTNLENLSQNTSVGILYLILPVMAGFMVIVLFRVIAEAIKAIVVIANNTKNN